MVVLKLTLDILELKKKKVDSFLSNSFGGFFFNFLKGGLLKIVWETLV